ncbi:MAG: N-carbamoylputrescine amidase [Phycisphaerales bacterium]|jgi:N-carbamoylputrescine amidase
MEDRPQPAEHHGTVRLGLTQFACGESPEANRAKQMALIEQAASQGANIVCTQELFTSLYFCQGEDHRFFDYAETIPGPSTEAMQAIAKKHGVVIVGSLFERRAQGLYHNTAVVIDADGSLLGIYRKMHIPDDPHYYEKFYFTPGDTGSGDTGFRVFDTAFGRLGVLVCWDQWFPEAARLTALQGAQILVYPTAIGWHPAEKAEYGETQHDAWEVMQRSHAIANGCFVAAANRVGLEHVNDESGKPFSAEGIEFWGQSFVAAPDGRVLQRASDQAEEVIIVDCDLSRVEFSRTHWPFLRDRRIDAYSEITKRFID